MNIENGGGTGVGCGNHAILFLSGFFPLYLPLFLDVSRHSSEAFSSDVLELCLFDAVVCGKEFVFVYTSSQNY